MPWLYVIRNLSWLLFGGLISSLGILLATFFYHRSVFLMILELPNALAMTIPFGQRVENHKELIPGFRYLDRLFNVFWFFSVGWLLVLNHLVFGVLLSLSILGLPLAKQHWKLLKYSAFPFGKMLSPVNGEPNEATPDT